MEKCKTKPAQVFLFQVLNKNLVKVLNILTVQTVDYTNTNLTI